MVPGALSSHDLLDGIAGWEQLISWACARQAELVAQFARRRPGPYAPDEAGPTVSEFAADEIAARRHITRRAAENKLALGLDPADRLPGTAAALRAGRIDVGKAKAIAELTTNPGRRGLQDRGGTGAGPDWGPDRARAAAQPAARGGQGGPGGAHQAVS